MKLSKSDHSVRPWRIHEIAPDFRVEDVWSYRTPGAGPDDFPAMLEALQNESDRNVDPRVVRLLFAVRWKLGGLFGWDNPEQGVGRRVDSLRDRLPPDLRQDPIDSPWPDTPFTMVYETSNECVLEMANRTVHHLCHLGWVQAGSGDYELRMAALVKPHGLLGRVYMAAIKPFRYAVIYPALTRKWERAWLLRDQHTSSTKSSSVGHQIRGGITASSVLTRPTSRADKKRPMGAPHTSRNRLVTWGGRLIVLYGTAHTVGALTAEGAARHAGTWFSGQLWNEELASMSPAMSAYWLSINSFGPPMVLLGLTVLWLNRRGIPPPRFIPWALGAWVVVGTVVAGPGVGQDLLLLAGSGLILAGTRRAPASVELPEGPHASRT